MEFRKVDEFFDSPTSGQEHANSHFSSFVGVHYRLLKLISYEIYNNLQMAFVAAGMAYR